MFGLKLNSAAPGTGSGVKTSNTIDTRSLNVKKTKEEEEDIVIHEKRKENTESTVTLLK